MSTPHGGCLAAGLQFLPGEVSHRFEHRVPRPAEIVLFNAEQALFDEGCQRGGNLKLQRRQGQRRRTRTRARQRADGLGGVDAEAAERRQATKERLLAR